MRFNTLLAAISAFYFGWKFGVEHPQSATVKVQNMDVMIPQAMYDRLNNFGLIPR